MKLAPLALNHVGITVPDIHAAIDWYGEVFGCTHIMGPRLLEADARATAETGAVSGPGFRRMLQAHLLTGNGVGIGLFDPKPLPPAKGPDYQRRGPWHIALTHPNVAYVMPELELADFSDERQAAVRHGSMTGHGRRLNDHVGPRTGV